MRASLALMRPFDAAESKLILAFLARIGIPVVVATLDEKTFLPAMTVRGGAILVDPDRLEHPGDLLHEAGHIALTDPALRPKLDAVGDDPGEEMGAIAWSWAALLALGLAPEILFHDAGYRGASAAFIANFSAGRTLGVPMLACWGMTAEPHRAGADGLAPYPAMTRWLR